MNYTVPHILTLFHSHHSYQQKLRRTLASSLILSPDNYYPVGSFYQLYLLNELGLLLHQRVSKGKKNGYFNIDHVKQHFHCKVFLFKLAACCHMLTVHTFMERKPLLMQSISILATVEVVLPLADLNWQLHQMVEHTKIHYHLVRSSSYTSSAYFNLNSFHGKTAGLTTVVTKLKLDTKSTLTTNSPNQPPKFSSLKNK